MSKKIKIDFFKIEVPENSNKSFEEMIEYTSSLQLNDESRTLDINNVPIRLHKSQKWNNGWEGNMVRIRMSGIPLKASRRGTLSTFPLKEDEGMGEQNAFFYHSKTQILALQTSQYGVSIATLIRYFEEMNGLNQLIYANPVLHKDALLRLEKIETVRKFEFSAAGLENMGIFKGEDYGVKEMTNLTDIFQSPQIEVKLSVGRSKTQSLSPENIKRTITQLFHIANQSGQKVKKIRVSGRTVDDELIYLDLLKDRMQELLDLPSDPSKYKDLKRMTAYEIRQDLVREAWLTREKEILSMFLPPTEE